MANLSLTMKLLSLRLKRAFNLSNASAIEKQTFIARYGNGIGEGSPSIHYGLSADEVLHHLQDGVLPAGGFDHAQQLIAYADTLSPPFSIGRCALEMAALDSLARTAGVPLHRYLGLQRPGDVISSFTVTNGTEREIREQLEYASVFESIKLKVGFKGDLGLVDLVLRHGSFRLRLDANGGWSTDETIERLRSWSGYPIEFVEQPTTDPQLRDLDKIKSRIDCKLFLDETIQSIDDIIRLAPVIDGVNLKLSKCGGIMTTIKMAEEARRRGLELLLGCMIETTVGITAALQLASLFDYYDLDAILLTENDPYWGTHFDGQTLIAPEGNGIGITTGEESFV